MKNAERSVDETCYFFLGVLVVRLERLHVAINRRRAVKLYSPASASFKMFISVFSKNRTHVESTVSMESMR